MKKNIQRQQGFTLLETIVVIGIMCVITGIAIVQSFGSMETYKANSAMDIAVGQFRVAREIAITQRRNVQITFNQTTIPHSITYQVLPAPASTEQPGTPVTIPLPSSTQFVVEAGVPNTPMNFPLCSTNPICIGNVGGGPALMQFTSTGQFTDGTGINVLNGTLLIGMPSQPATARAVTIMGGTGRVRQYKYVGSNKWIQ
jgi:prepilin-type N-terminal cleavage/methylation domain-containing protein